MVIGLLVLKRATMLMSIIAWIIRGSKTGANLVKSLLLVAVAVEPAHDKRCL